MSYSYSYTDTLTFTRTHAKHLAAKVATDLKRMQRFYDRPSDREIADYETEAIEFLKEGYLGTVTYGFRRNSNWIEPYAVLHGSRSCRCVSEQRRSRARSSHCRCQRGLVLQLHDLRPSLESSERSGAGGICRAPSVPEERSAAARHRRIPERRI